MAYTAGDLLVVNQALANLGHTTQVGNLDNDQTVEAKNARLFFARELDIALGAGRWKWAEKRAVLTELTGTGAWWDDIHRDWSRIYQLPADCAVPRIVWSGTRNPAPTDPPVPFESVFDSAGATRVLLCDVDPVTTGTEKAPLLVYTARIADAAKYPQPFQAFFAWRLSFALAVPLKKGAQLASDALKAAALAFHDAWAFDRSSLQRDPPPPSPSIAARGTSRRFGQQK